MILSCHLQLRIVYGGLLPDFEQLASLNRDVIIVSCLLVLVCGFICMNGKSVCCWYLNVYLYELCNIYQPTFWDGLNCVSSC